jgi:hypothetical protein
MIGGRERSRWILLSLGVLVVLVISAGVAWVVADDTTGTACNGHVELCDRAYDEVSYAATHNSMAAAAEPGWLFPEQPDGIIAQLDHGVRVLLVDSWYGQSTDRRGIVATAGSTRADALREARGEFGALVVRASLRARGAVGLTPKGPVRPYLCHAMCELGSTSWRRSLEDLRGWLDEHPREVVTLFVQDEVSPSDTAAVVAHAGLLPYVYTPESAGWPTLGSMIESGRRLVVLMENHGGGTTYPWLLQGFDWVQDTPYLFHDPAEFSCKPNRGDPEASLFLVNHWIKSRTRIAQNAEAVNVRDVLLPRLEQCRTQRGRLPNYVAVDYYDRGDVMAVVDELNGF